MNEVSAYLEHCEKWLPKSIEILSRLVLTAVKVEFSSKNLHTEKSKDHNEEEEKEQKWGNCLDRIK